MTKTCWSTPTASSPVYMMFTQPSFDASTNSDISACKYTRCHKKHQPRTTACTRHRVGTYGRRAFATAGPSAWNSLPDPVHNPNSTEAALRRLLKTFPLTVVSALGRSTHDALYKSSYWHWSWKSTAIVTIKYMQTRYKISRQCFVFL